MHIIIMLLLISLLILVHELGHFSVARFFKIKVDRFGFGLPFGPTLWEKKIGDVTYCVHAFLLGGYVSFPDDDPESDIPEDDPGRLANRPIWERACVVSAGVIANALLAFLIVIGVVVFGEGVPTDYDKVHVEELADTITIAKDAGMKPGDIIYAINDYKVESFNNYWMYMYSNRADDNKVVESDITKQLKKIINANSKLFKSLGYDPENITKNDLIEITNLIVPDKVIKVPEADYEKEVKPNLNDPFAALELRSSDQGFDNFEKQLKTNIRNVMKNKFSGNGETTFGEVAKVSADCNHFLTLVVDRNGKKVKLEVIPNDKGQIGFKHRIEQIFEPATSFGQIMSGSWNYLYSKTAIMCIGLYKIFTGQISLWDLHGIVAITKVGGEVIAKKGMIDGWLLTALISIDLAIVNLLPIPALDGGHLLFLLLEKLRGRPVEEKYLEAATKFGFIFLIGLMIFIIFNDILGIVTGKF